MSDMSRVIRSLLGRPANWIADQVTGATGLVAVRVPLERAHGPNARTIPLPGYMQVTNFGCGGVAAAMAARYLRPELEFGDAYDAVSPLPETGAGIRRVAKGLRACGVKVTVRKDLTFAGLAQCIRSKQPVLVVIRNPGAVFRHWVVIYGFSRHPNLVYLATNGLPWLTSNRINWTQFKQMWEPRGSGLVCSRALRRPRRRPSQFVSK